MGARPIIGTSGTVDLALYLDPLHDDLPPNPVGEVGPCSDPINQSDRACRIDRIVSCRGVNDLEFIPAADRCTPEAPGGQGSPGP